MKQIIKQGTTSKRLVIFVQDSSKTTGAGLTGVTAAASGFTWYYYREDSTAATVVTGTTETLGTWTSGGFVEISSANMPGFYEIGVPNAVLAATNGPTWATMQLSGVTNMVPVNIELELSAFDLTTNTVTANVVQWLGTAVTAATGGIPDVNTKNYNNQTAATDANNLPKIDVVDWAGAAVSAPNIAGKPVVDVVDWLGTAVSAVTGGVPDVNVKNYNNHGAATDANNLPKVDVEDFGGTAGTFTSGVPNANASLSGTINANVVKWLGTAVTSTTGGVPDVNVENWQGVAVSNVNTPGIPVVDIGLFGGHGVTFSGTFPEVAVATNLDKTGYSIAAGQITVKKNTALAGFTFPMFGLTAPNSLKTGLSVTAQRSIDGGSVSGTTNAVTEIGSGIYELNLAAADLNGNSITFIFTAAGALDASVTIVTQP